MYLFRHLSYTFIHLSLLFITSYFSCLITDHSLFCSRSLPISLYTNVSSMFPFQSFCTCSFHLLKYSLPRYLHSLFLYFTYVKHPSSEMFSDILQYSYLFIFTITFQCFIFHQGSFGLLILLERVIPLRNTEHLLHTKTLLDTSNKAVKGTYQVLFLIDLTLFMDNSAV